MREAGPERDEEQLEKVPRHVGIIMDGNGRWARERGLPHAAGHRAGTENLRPILRAMGEFGVKVVTLYAFSTENWKRPDHEVRALMVLAGRVIDDELDALDENGVRLNHIGRQEGLPKALLDKVAYAKRLTCDNDRLIVNIAFNYGGRAELVDAVRRIVADGVPAEEIDEALISHYLYSAGLPDPDLIIRTAGEMRLSNFLIWQAAYAEYYSTPTYWPDFDRDELLRALRAYQARDRRYGGRPG